VASLRSQRLRDWEIVAAGTPPASPLRALHAPEIRVVELDVDQSLAGAYERCRAHAAGDVLLLLVPGETLAPSALAKAVTLLDGSEDTTPVAYADEDCISAAGSHHTPFLRPDWSPDYLLSALYIDRAFFVRRAAVDAVGGLRAGYDPVPEWDLLLRLSELGRPFAHVRQVLFHRPGEPGRAWRPADPALIAAGRRAVADACRRRGIAAEVEPQAVAGTYRVRRTTRLTRQVSLIVPFRDGAVLLERCVRSVLRHGGPVPLEIVLVDNGSVETETAKLLRELAAEPGIRVLSAPGGFNYSALVNRGVSAATGDVICLLNSDVEATSSGWLEPLLDAVEQPDVGAVGARLLYPDGSVQHAGMILGVLGGTGHAHRFAPRDAAGYFANMAVVREVSAVTGACLATRRETLERTGGFDEALPTAYNDVDFCLRLQERGLRVLYTPYAELLHHEGASRGRGDAAEQARAYMRRRWGARLEIDPYYHPGLSRTSEGYTLAPTPLVSSRAAAFANVQGRRLRWLVQDIAAGMSGWLDTIATLARPATCGPGVALLAGAPLAVRGKVNRYHIRIVNGGPLPLDVSLTLDGSIRVAREQRAFRVATTRAVAAGATLDLACETDWCERFAFVEASGLAALLTSRSPTGRCELKAALRAPGATDIARIEQPLIA
jgi:GT2 family glycosyltransferase